jgi:hypothetical protein
MPRFQVYPDAGVAAMLSHQWGPKNATAEDGGPVTFRLSSLNDRCGVCSLVTASQPDNLFSYVPVMLWGQQQGDSTKPAQWQHQLYAGSPSKSWLAYRRAV